MATKRTIMRSFKLNEISAVDNPAQEGARAVLLKRKGEPGYDPKNPDRSKRGSAAPADLVGEDLLEKRDFIHLLTGAWNGHAHGMMMRPGDNGGSTDFARGPEDLETHNHQWIMDAEGNIKIGMNDGHDHEVDGDQINQAFMAIASSRIADEVAELLGKSEFSSETRKKLTEEGKALPDGSFPIVTKTDLTIAVAAFNRAGDKKQVAKHINERANALEATDLLPTEGRLADLLDKVGIKEDSTMTDKTQKAEEQLKAAEDKNKELEAQLAEATALGQMNDAQKAYFAGLDKSLDDDKRSEFISKSADERQAIVEKVKQDAEDSKGVVYKDAAGNEYTKSDDPRLVAMVKRNDELAADLAKSKADLSEESLTKRAEDLKHIPGDVEVRKAMLKSIDSIEDEGTRTKAHEALKAQNAAMSKAFQTGGFQGGEVELGDVGGIKKAAEGKLDEMAKKYAEDHKVSKAVGYAEVTKTEEGAKLYMEAVGDPDTTPRFVN